MAQCKKCREELSSTAVFCKKCGTAIVKETNMESDIDKLGTFQELSLEMRKISDQMIAYFVSSMKQIEVEKNMILDNSEKEVLRLKEQVSSSDRELDSLKLALSEKEKELEIANKKMQELENNVLQISGNDMEIKEMEEQVQLCNGCGEVITEDMFFCGSCGMKLK